MTRSKIISVLIKKLWHIKDISTMFHPDVNVFIGVNGSSKTTFLNLIEGKSAAPPTTNAGEQGCSGICKMGMSNTPFIVVRHYDKVHPHCHIVFSMIDNKKKILTQTTIFKRNERVCKAINKKFGLNTSQSKEIAVALYTRFQKLIL